MKKSTALRIAAEISLIIAITAVIASAAIYKLAQSNNSVVTVTEGTTFIPVNLTPATTTINEGQQVQLTAAVTNPNGVGKTVSFMEGTTQIGTAAILDLGGGYYAASLIITPTAGIHTYHTAPEA